MSPTVTVCMHVFHLSLRQVIRVDSQNSFRTVNKRKPPRILGQNKHPASPAIQRNNWRNSKTCIHAAALRPVTHIQTHTLDDVALEDWEIVRCIYDKLHSKPLIRICITSHYIVVRRATVRLQFIFTRRMLQGFTIFTLLLLLSMVWSMCMGTGYRIQGTTRHTVCVCVRVMRVHFCKWTNGCFSVPDASNDSKCERPTPDTTISIEFAVKRVVHRAECQWTMYAVQRIN